VTLQVETTLAVCLRFVSTLPNSCDRTFSLLTTIVIILAFISSLDFLFKD